MVDELTFERKESNGYLRRYYVLKRANGGTIDTVLDQVTGRPATEMVSNELPIWDGRRLIYLKQNASGEWATAMYDQKIETVLPKAIAIFRAIDGRLIVQTTVEVEESIDLINWNSFRNLRYDFSDGAPIRFFRLKQR